MVKLRLARGGGKKRPFYRVIVADCRNPRDGRFIEQIGTYNPMLDPEVFELKGERVEHWLSMGAQATGPVARLIRKHRKQEQVSA